MFLEANMAVLGIDSFGVTLTTLEEVLSFCSFFYHCFC